MTANRLRWVALVILLFVLVFSGPAGYVAAQDYPSHLQAVARPNWGFTSYELPFFESLSTYQHGVILNVSRQNFTSASAQEANYSEVVKTFQQLSLEGYIYNNTALSAITLSGDALRDLVAQSKRFDELYLEQTSLGASDPHGNQSVRNALEMQGLVSDIHATVKDINTTTGAISSVAVPAGLDATAFKDNLQILDSYSGLLDGQLSNVTNLAFLNTTTTIGLNMTEARYGDQMRINGSVQPEQAGVSNGSVVLYVDRLPQIALQTDDTGRYNYTYTIDNRAGSHVVFAHCEPNNSPYLPSNSTNATFTVQKDSVTNSLSQSSGTLVSGSVIFAGRLTTTQGTPVRSAVVTLYADGKPVRGAVTGQDGSYKIVYKQNRLEVAGTILQPDAMTFYTEFNSSALPLEVAKSDVITLPVLGTYVVQGVGSPGGAAVTVVALTVVLGGTYFVRQRRRRALMGTVAAPADETATTARDERGIETPVPRSEAVLDLELAAGPASVEEPQPASDLWPLGREKAAVATLYGGALALIAETGSARIKPSMTHREILAAVGTSLPAIRSPLKGLTELYELARFSGRTVTEQHVEAAVSHLRSIEEHVRLGEGM